MHIHKLDDALLLLGHARLAGRPVLTVTVGYVCGMDGHRLTEQEAWQWLMPLFPDEPFDLAEKKAGGGFGVAGDACAPAGMRADGLTVRAGVGELHARVLVQGDRHWHRTVAGWQATPPQPFERMPIGLVRAYGGPDWRDNPYGRGHAGRDAYEGVPLPNVEHPDHPVLKPSDTPATATLGPYPIGSTARNQWLGKIDDAWVRTRLPWLPDDTDPRWFDRFSPQQCRSMYWRGDEPWFAENMHPRHEVLQGRLPGLRPRLLLRTVAEPDRHTELGLELDTVWLMPNDQRVVVLYRAQTAVKREDAKDVMGLAVFTESLSEPAQPLAHWSAVWRKALEQEAQPLPVVAPLALSDDELARLEADRLAVEQNAAAFQASLEKDIDEATTSAQAEAEEQLRAHGLSVEAMKARAAKNDTPEPLPLPPLGPMPSNPAAFRAKLEAHVQSALKQAEADARAKLESRGFNVDAMLAYSKAHPVPEPSAAEAAAKAVALMPIPAAQRQAYIDEFVAFQKEMDGLGDTLKAQFEEADQASAAALGAGTAGRHADPLDTPTGPRERLTRDALIERAASGGSAAWTELENLDLSAADLAGLDLRRSVLRGCDLREAHLQGADLTEALLENCILEGAELGGVRLTRAHLTDCGLDDARFQESDFTQALITRCSFDRAALSSTCWNDAQLSECSFAAASLGAATGRRARFTACRLAAADASGSCFASAEFDQCEMDGARFGGATLTGATLMACQAAHAQFDHTVMPGLRTLLDTRLDQANLSGADLEGASLQNTSLVKAVLREARFDRALVKECDLTGTDAWRMVAREADFSDSRIAQASWRGVNLMQASFGYTTLFDTDLTGANLHAAQTRTATVQGLVLDGALMTRCRLLQEYGHG